MLVYAYSLFFTRTNMKLLMVLVLLGMVSGCATVGGALEGAGKDLGRAGDFIQRKVGVDKVKYEDQ